MTNRTTWTSVPAKDRAYLRSEVRRHMDRVIGKDWYDRVGTSHVYAEAHFAVGIWATTIANIAMRGVTPDQRNLWGYALAHRYHMYRYHLANEAHQAAERAAVTA